METLTLPGRKTDRFLQMGMSKNLGGFKSGSRDIINRNKISLRGLPLQQ